MVRVSTSSGEFPQSLFIRNVKFGSTSSDKGGFASIFKGTYGREVVAVKRLHLGPVSAEDTRVIHKVYISLMGMVSCSTKKRLLEFLP
jgi:hypothetical protein